MHLEDKIDHEVYEQLVESFIELHQRQFEAIGLPKIHWRDLCMKLKDEVFDAGHYFQIRQRVDEDDNILGYKAVCISEKGLKKDDPQSIYLVDHAWTYRTNDARGILRANENLLERVCMMMNVQVDETDKNLLKEKKIEGVVEKMWKYNQTYKIATDKLSDDEREPLWYVMDEFGSAIRHNDDPTVRCAPFYFMATGVMFSVIWPVEDLEFGDEITRDYVHNIEDEKLRQCKLIPWIEDPEDEDYEFEDEDPRQTEPETDYFLANRKEVHLPEASKLATVSLNFPKDKKIKVFTNFKSKSLVKQFLDDEKFELVDKIEEADIRWISQHFREYTELNEKYPNVLINQFAFDDILTCKDMLAIASRRVEGHEDWLPITYNMNNELSKFITYFKKRENEGLDNYWILKPWNLRRSLDMVITNNLDQIIRNQETGPKIACKYLTNPVLFKRDDIKKNVKFDLRYYVLLTSVKPLKLSISRKFLIRFGNKEYSLDNFDDFEKHFTTMMYRDFETKHMHYYDFTAEFDKQYENFKWSEIEDQTFKMIRKVFEGASIQEPPRGIAHNPQSRSMYGVDVMLDWDLIEDGSKKIKPVICEFNYMPDCLRTCELYPSFFNEVFNALFVKEGVDDNFAQI